MLYNHRYNTITGKWNLLCPARFRNRFTKKLNGNCESRKITRPIKQGGFSLVELLTGLAIVSILVGAALPVYSSYTLSVRETAAKSRVHEIAMALEQYYSEHFNYQAGPRELDIPDSDQWFDYTITNSDRYSYRILATPNEDNRQKTAFQLDYLGRQYFRPVGSDTWAVGWP